MSPSTRFDAADENATFNPSPEMAGVPRRTLYLLLSGRQAWKAHQQLSIAAGLGMTWADLVAQAEDLME